MNHTTEPADLELSVVAAAQRADRTLRRILTAVLILGALIAGMLVSPPWAPRPAHGAVRPAAAASPVKGTVDVCTTGLGKSWTRGLEKLANRQLQQRVDVHRRSESNLAGCDVVVWRGGRVALNYVTGEPAANPRRDTYTGPYAIAKVEVNVGTITPKKARPQTIVDALKAGGIR